jgi:hypothetical protein
MEGREAHGEDVARGRIAERPLLRELDFQIRSGSRCRTIGALREWEGRATRWGMWARHMKRGPISRYQTTWRSDILRRLGTGQTSGHYGAHSNCIFTGQENSAKLIAIRGGVLLRLCGLLFVSSQLSD